MNKRIFEQLIQKNTNVFLYIVRKASIVDTDINKNIVNDIVNLTSFQRFNEYFKLNKALNLDNLKIFRNNLFDESSSKQSQNYNININNVKSINKFSYFFFSKNKTTN